MAISAVALAWIGAATAVVGTGLSYMQQRKAQGLQEEAADEQRKGSATQSARQTEQAAQERRQQIRQERIKRASIMQQSENTGTAGSSGAIGAVDGMSTMLNANLGANSAAIQSGQQITGFMQNAANYNQQAQSANNRAGLFSQVAGIGSGMFSQAGGWNTIFKRQ